MPFIIAESIKRTTNPPLTSTISPNIPNQNFEIAIFFSVLNRSGNYVFEDEHPHSPQGKGCKLCSGGIYKKGVRRNFGVGSLDWRSDVLVFCLIQTDQRVDTPPHTSYFPEMHLIEILRWPFVVIETSKRAQSI